MEYHCTPYVWYSVKRNQSRPMHFTGKEPDAILQHFFTVKVICASWVTTIMLNNTLIFREINLEIHNNSNMKNERRYLIYLYDHFPSYNCCQFFNYFSCLVVRWVTQSSICDLMDQKPTVFLSMGTSRVRSHWMDCHDLLLDLLNLGSNQVPCIEGSFLIV